MRKTFGTILAASAIALTLSVANAQERRGDRGRDRDRDSSYGEFDRATPAQLAVADRRLNEIYQRRIADARRDDRNDRRVRGWYSQEQALRDSERHWIAFRDGECRYLTQGAVGTRDHAALVRGCLVEQTEERTEELRDADVMLSSR